MVMPDFTVTTAAGRRCRLRRKCFLAVISVALYAAFLMLQTHRHREYFVGEDTPHRALEHGNGRMRHEETGRQGKASCAIPVLLTAYMVPIIFLAEQIGVPVDYVVETVHAPAALAGPDAWPFQGGGAGSDRRRESCRRAIIMQRSMNYFPRLGAGNDRADHSTILVVSHLTHHPIILGLQHTGSAAVPADFGAVPGDVLQRPHSPCCRAACIWCCSSLICSSPGRADACFQPFRRCDRCATRATPRHSPPHPAH